MPTMLQVWEERLAANVAEVPGPHANPTIIEWNREAGHPEHTSDEISWCSLSMCSAAYRAKVPFPPVNVNPMAKSWLTWGRLVSKRSVKPGDVVIWQRGAPGGPYGHVNIVRDVRTLPDGTVQTRNIGGNQGKVGAVTLTDWTDIDKCIAVRRLVRATVKDLRRSGSKEVVKADRIQNSGWLATIPAALVAAWNKITGPVQVPQFADIPESLDWWSTFIGGANAFWSLCLEYPWLAGSIMVGAICILAGHQIKSARVKRHAAGAPIAAEVARLTAAQHAKLEAA